MNSLGYMYMYLYKKLLQVTHTELVLFCTLFKKYKTSPDCKRWDVEITPVLVAMVCKCCFDLYSTRVICHIETVPTSQTPS